MVKATRFAAIGAYFLLCATAHAGVTALSVPGAGNFAGENWAEGSNWFLRAILLDSTHAPIGSLSPTVTSFNTLDQALVPAYVTVTLDAAAASGSIIRIYRSTSAFNVDDTGIQFADYSVCPCAAGSVSPTSNQRLPNADFANSGAVLPVRLQNFDVE